MLSNEEPVRHIKKVVIIVAVRNEQRYIGRCLDSLLNQDFPRDSFEIVVIDGMSEDQTRIIAEKYVNRFPDIIRIYDNPNRIQADRRNIGIRNSSSEFVLYIDGHSQPSTSYIAKLVSILRSSPDIAGVGGRHDSPDDETFFGKALNHAQKSFLGGAGSSYRHKKANFVDPLSFCMYRRSVLEKSGLYNESLVIGEDYGLHWRMRKFGYRLMVTPDAVVYYYRKYNTLARLFDRMMKYGFWKAKIVRIHPTSIRFVFALPIILIALWLSYIPLLLVRPNLAYLALFIIIGYAIAVLGTSILVVLREQNIKYLIIFVIIIIEHFAIGVGLIFGLTRR